MPPFSDPGALMDLCLQACSYSASVFLAAIQPQQDQILGQIPCEAHAPFPLSNHHVSFAYPLPFLAQYITVFPHIHYTDFINAMVLLIYGFLCLFFHRLENSFYLLEMIQ